VAGEGAVHAEDVYGGSGCMLARAGQGRAEYPTLPCLAFLFASVCLLACMQVNIFGSNQGVCMLGPGMQGRCVMWCVDMGVFYLAHHPLTYPWLSVPIPDSF
jgi:hypothetical protein